MGKTDNHGAAKSGQKGETILRKALEASGLSLLKKKNDFKGTEFEYKGTIAFPSPYDDGTFQSDGFIPELGIIVEIKYGEKHGSTEEKAIVDLEKIRDGVYGSKYPLVYFFWGTPEVPGTKTTGRCWAYVFRDKIKKEKLPVEVVFATTNDGFNKWVRKMKKLLR
jgi:hypothetical protein